MSYRTVFRSVYRSAYNAVSGVVSGGGSLIPASLRQLLYPGNQPAYYTEEQFPDHSHLLKDYSSGVGSLRPKRLGYCYDFDGVDDYVVIGTGADFAFGSSVDFSFSCWVKYDGTDGYVFSSNEDGKWWAIRVDSGALIGYIDDNVTLKSATKSGVGTNTWHHIAVTFDREGNAIAYVDASAGTPVDISSVGDIDHTDPVEIGRRSSSNNYGGMVSDTRIYNDVLTPDEVTYLYTNGQSGTDPGKANLLAHYPLQEESGPTAYDIGPNGNHGTITNAVTSGVGSIHQPDAGVTKSYPNDEGYSRRMVFDGVDDYVEVTGMTAHTHYFGACTISAKVYITNLTSNQNIWALGLKAYRLLLTNLGEWSHGNNTVTGVYATLGEHELSVDYDASGRAISFSVDGVEVWTGVGAGSNSGTSFFIGSGDGSSLFFKGLIWDFAITGSAVKNFAFEGYGNTDADWVDTTGGDNNGTVNGSPDNVYIPAATATLDALGGTLTETGEVPRYGTALGYGWQGNGSTVRVDIGTAQTWTLTNTWKVTIHFKLESTASTQTLLYIGDGSSSITVQYRASIGFLCAFFNSLFFGPSAASLSAAADGNWHTISIEHLGSNSIVVTLDGVVVANGNPNPDTGASIGFNILSRGPGSYADASIGPVTITTGGVTTSYHPIPGTRDVAKVLSNAEGSVISNAVVNGVLADLYTIGNGSWRLPHIENGAHWDGTAIYPAGPGQANAVNGEAINIPANVAPRGLLTDRTGGTIAPLDYAMDTDTLTDETFDEGVAPAGKRFADDNYSDRYGAAVTDISENAYFEPRGFVASVGTSTSPTSTGTKSVTGVGFQPKLLMPFGDLDNADGTDLSALLGFGAGTSSTSRASVAVSSQNAQTTSNSDRRHTNASIITLLSSSGTVLEEADLDSLDSNGFTLDWTSADSTARILNHIALGGTDLEVSLTQHQMNGTNLPQSFAHGLTGGAPTALLFFGISYHLAPPATATISYMNIGGWSNGTQWAAAGYTGNGSTTSETNRALYNNGVLSWTVTNLRRLMAVGSVDATNVNVTYPNTVSTVPFYFFMVAIRGAKAQVGTFDCNGSTAALPIACSGITPKLFLPIFLPGGVDNPGTVQNGLAMTIGASDGTNHVSCGITDQNGVTTTNARRYQDSTGLSEYDFDGTLEFDATCSFDGESVIIDPSVNTGTGWGQGGYLILGT